MTGLKMFFCFLCAVSVSGGQIVVKKASIAWAQSGTLFNSSVITWLIGAVFIYALSALGWLYILKSVPLATAYPFLSLTFLLVPIAGCIIFNEYFDWRDVFAMTLIIFGICINAFNHSVR